MAAHRDTKHRHVHVIVRRDLGAWMNRVRPLNFVHLLMTTDRKGPAKGKKPFRMIRFPGRLALASGLGGTLEAVLVDGEPVASSAPGGEREALQGGPSGPGLVRGLLPCTT